MHDAVPDTSMKTPAMLAAGALSAIGATACCFAPLLLVMLGFGGAWAARMKSLEPLQPIFFATTLGFMAVGFYQFYVLPRKCVAGQACALPHVLRRQRIAWWIVAAIIALMGAFPLFASYFY
jgi:mercuric ion transport protein